MAICRAAGAIGSFQERPMSTKQANSTAWLPSTFDAFPRPRDCPFPLEPVPRYVLTAKSPDQNSAELTPKPLADNPFSSPYEPSRIINASPPTAHRHLPESKKQLKANVWFYANDGNDAYDKSWRIVDPLSTRPRNSERSQANCGSRPLRIASPSPN